MKRTIVQASLAAPLAMVALAGVSAKATEPPTPAVTEIVIGETVHSATPNYPTQDLVNILDLLRPDVILFEYPADMMTPTFEFKSIIKGSLEQEAVVVHFEMITARAPCT